MRGNHGLRLRGLTLVALVVASLLPASADAGNLTFSVNLRTGVGDPAVPPYITYESPLQDTNGDGYFETVLRINLHDPSINNPFVAAVFQVQYDAEPAGDITVNIGDSRTNNGHSGDSATQSNDAEVQIGSVPTTDDRTFYAFGKDATPGGPTLETVPDFAAAGRTVKITVANDFVAWDNNQGVSGSLTSPYLFALAGQPDSEGPVNYDIYAAFNRVVGYPPRLGSGAAQVTVTLLTAVPEPSSLGLVGIGILGSICYGRSRGRGQKPARTDH